MNNTIEIKPLPKFGAIIYTDLNKATEQQIDEIKSALYEYKFVVIKKQTIKPEKYIEFANHLGKLISFYEKSYTHPQHPEIFVVSNKKDTEMGVDRVGLYWHSDCSFLKNPLPLTMLYAQEVPDEGGYTNFIDMENALEKLSDYEKIELQNASAEHSGMNRTIILKKHLGLAVDELLQQIENEIPTVTHPTIISHPVNQKHALYISEGFTTNIKLPDGKILDKHNLLQKIYTNANQHAHQWEKGDIIIWDNRQVQHKAESAKSGNRVMYRIGINDNLPLYC